MKGSLVLSTILLFISIVIIQCEREKMPDSPVIPGATITDPEPNANETGNLERELYNLVNQYREANQLNQLNWSNTISKQCRYHSNDIASGRIPFGHDGKEARLEKIRNTFPNAVGAELIYQQNSGYQFYQKAIDHWKNDQNRNQILVGNYQRMGIGIAKSENGNYVVTMILIFQEN
jgi:uncharacterized protein YkwD